jgi:hypothetical protein
MPKQNLTTLNKLLNIKYYLIFDIYKPGQAKYTRLGSAFGFGIVVVLGCLLLYQKLEGADFGLWVSTMVPVGICAGFAVLIFWLSSRPSVADFLIAAESEIRGGFDWCWRVSGKRHQTIPGAWWSVDGIWRTSHGRLPKISG